MTTAFELVLVLVLIMVGRVVTKESERKRDEA